MVHNEHNAAQSTVIGAERRAYRRHPVRLPALYQTGDGRQWGCEIKDLCIGGVYLATTDPPPAAPPEVGTPISLYCTLPGEADPLTFQIRIVRHDGRHCGAAFLDPDLAALQQLLDYAQRQPRQPATEPLKGQDQDTAREGMTLPPATLIGDCEAMARNLADSLGQEFPQCCSKQIFDAVDGIKRPQEQNAYFSAAGILANNGEQFRRAFTTAVERRLAAGPEAPATPEAPQPEVPTRLALVEDEVFEDWLATTDMIDHAETRNQEALRLLEQRLSLLFDKAIDSKCNPFGAPTFAHAFQEAIKQLDLEHVVMQLCYGVFRQMLTRETGQLYEKMNAHLVEHGVLPDLEFALPARPAHPRAVPPTPPQTGPTPGMRQDTAADPAEDGPSMQDTPWPQTPSASPPGPGPVTPQAMAGVAGPTIQAMPTAGSAAVATGTTASSSNLYEVFDQLQALQSSLRRRRSLQPMQGNSATPPPTGATPGIGNGAGTTPDGRESAAPQSGASCQYSTEDILEVLTELQQNPPPQALAEQGYLDTVQSLLASHKGEAGEIPVRERNIISVAGNLFQSLLQDMLIASNVRNWIQRLEVPLLKLALEDEDLFLDKEHVARQVVNQIARLELYEEGNQTGAQNAIHRKINRILDQIARQPEVKRETFAHARTELDRLVQLQDEAYQANLQDLRQACAQEQRQLDVAGAAARDLHYLAVSENSVSALALEGQDTAEREAWLRKVHRLKVGEWLLFHDKAGEAQRLRLAWVTKKQDRYVFVNLRGLRELTLSDLELATRLCQGTAMALENADDPALDRAQYNMLQSLHRQLLHESTHDPLTGLLNRREFERLLRENLQDGAVDGEYSPVLCYLDIDHFHVINNRCGFEAGDRLLMDIRDRLLALETEQAHLGRLGNDDFAALLPPAGVAQARETMQQWLDELTSSYRFHHDGRSYPIALSIGLVPLSIAPSEITGLLQTAENSCRVAREKGGNRIHVHCSDDEALANKQALIYWLSRVDAALAEDSLELRCQPIVPLTSEGCSAPHHSEVLLAMHGEDGKPVSPEGFILAAEHYNRMPAIDRCVIRRVLRWMREHEPLLEQTGGLAVNLSGRSLNDESFRDFILDEISQSGVDTSRLCFEVTETAGINSLSAAADFILAVKETGCSFSLDDFGSGMSSYGYLKNLPVDYLKIDGAFVREMDCNPEDYAVVKSITEIGHFMGKKIIAEYVESGDILALLREIGVDYAQGYAVGRPRLLREIAGGS